MSIETPSFKESEPGAKAEVFDPSIGWETVREDVLALEQACFGDKSFPESDLQSHFENPEHIAVLLRKKDRIIGFTCGIPDEEVEGALYIETTDILPEEQGQRHVVSLMNTLEDEARRRGYRFITRNAAISNGYADKVQKNYAARIVESYENDSEWGPQRYFKIALD